MQPNHYLLTPCKPTRHTVCLALAIGTAAAVGSMILSPAIAVFVMAGVSIVNVPYSAYKEIRIIKLPGKCSKYWVEIGM